ncbi:cyclopropane-fatty-acyl-phospholipid synthase family protein [Nocardioides sp. R-C-SC26]|uniref:SAM-dependent methyltransferase n=1 Tax=Nocardioides sp. R-C-SC26 TaxID=2870414 RepID=UPI001E35AB66|nr:class I SAM-dependent methyltransferase [Nocardioides sp. R-C-SC26]
MNHAHGHGSSHGDTPTDLEQMFTQTFWDERYASSTRVWSGQPNRRLVEELEALPVTGAGVAVDVGCGEGADAVWLGRQGWRTIGIDVSQVAVDRATAHAADAGLAEQVSFERADVYAGDPVPGPADLVTSCFMHTPPESFDRIYAAIADAVAPGGTLVVLAHHPDDATTGLRNPELNALLIGPDQVLAVLEAHAAAWDVAVAEGRTRSQKLPEGGEVIVTDTVVRAVRRA